jgi:hypothetical protein
MSSDSRHILLANEGYDNTIFSLEALRHWDFAFPGVSRIPIQASKKVYMFSRVIPVERFNKVVILNLLDYLGPQINSSEPL